MSSEAAQVLPLKNPGAGQWHSSVYCFSLSNGRLIRKYLFDKESVFLNDLTVAEDRTVYITETRDGAIYKINPEADRVEPFLEPTPFTFLNGICFTDKPGRLYVSSHQGILSVDIDTRQNDLLPAAPDINAGSIDGVVIPYRLFYSAPEYQNHPALS